jgi:hypothetical protein
LHAQPTGQRTHPTSDARCQRRCKPLHHAY